MNQEQVARFALAFRKLADRVIVLEKEVAELKDEEAEEDVWLADFLREIDLISASLDGPTPAEAVA